jgi:hypothetical protein
MERTAITIAGTHCEMPGKINVPDELWRKLCEEADGDTNSKRDFTGYFDTVVKELDEPGSKTDTDRETELFCNAGKHADGVAGREGGNVSSARCIAINPDKAYIITDGASGLGIELAKWLVDKGARKLVLISRKGPKTEYDKNLIQSMILRGVAVNCECLDIAFSQAVINCVGRIRLNAPIGGVIHSSAVVRDVTVPYMTEKVFEAVFIPKVVGAWNLHLALGDEPVDFFLNISTISSIFGLSGHSIYSAAHQLMDDFAVHRRQSGMSAHNINLGVLGQYSGALRNEENALHVLESQGWVPLLLKQVTAKIERIILEGERVEMAADVD